MFKELCKNILAYIFPKEPIIEHLEELSLDDFRIFLSAKCGAKDQIATPRPWIHSLLPYRDPYVEKIIHEIKYYHNENLAKKLAIALELAIPEDFQGTIIPLPPRRKRLIEYGFDQNLLVISELPPNLHKLVRTDILIRNNQANFSLTKMKRAQRLASRNSLYHPHPDFTPNQAINHPIILYDDVTTTGASLEDARRCLTELGVPVDRVTAITLAH